MPRGELVVIEDKARLAGHGEAVLYDLDGNVLQAVPFTNLITQYGDQWLAEGRWGIGTHVPATGMQLGTGTTTPAKTGGGSAIGAYIAGSSVAFSVGPASSLVSGARRIQVVSEWGAGIATNGAITEIAIINQAVALNTTAPAGNTLARAKFASALNKVAASVLVVTWRHDHLGA